MPPRYSATQLNLCLHDGAVFYLVDRSFSSAEPHYFIVLNHDPGNDELLVVTVASSQIDNVKRRRSFLPAETLVEIAENEYEAFTKDSIIDCNSARTKSKMQVLEQLNSGGSQVARMPADILNKLRAGVLASPVVEPSVKELLQEPSAK